MTTTDRMLLSIVLLSTLALVGWLLQTVSANSGRLSVLEQRAMMHDTEMRDIKQEMRDHRNKTEQGTFKN